MTWRRALVVATMLAACAMAMAGCADSDSESDWITFQNEYVSLQLPDSFVGGDPADPAAMAALEELVGSVPDQERRLRYYSWLDDAMDGLDERDKTDVASTGILLAVFGQPNAEGSVPNVVVTRFNVDVVMSPTEQPSLEAWVTKRMPVPESEWTIDSIAEDRAYFVLRHMAEGPDDTAFHRYDLYRAAGEYIYLFQYIYYGEADADLDAVFRASVDTTVVKGDHGLPKAFANWPVWNQDHQAKALVYAAMDAIELAEWDLRTFDPSTMTADILTQHRSDISFNAVESEVAASAPTSEASRDEVDYWGDEDTYAVGTLSESGKAFGVIVNRSDRSTDVPDFYVDGEMAEW